jgi:hypothetical protein
MTDADLDRCYTALCHALGDVGRERSELLLAMVALGLLASSDRADDVLALVAKARERCLAELDGHQGGSQVQA